MAYRVLSLDGGGSWALIEVKALMKIYGDPSGRDLLSHFDLVAATSGGSIVLGCLLENMKLSQILNFFKNAKQRKEVFSPTDNPIYRLFGWTDALPKYSMSNKLQAIQKALPKAGACLMDSFSPMIKSNRSKQAVHLLITAFDYNQNRAAFFRSERLSRPEWGTGAALPVTLAQAIHASSNPPVKYFDAPAELPGPNLYWDGAVAGCNNPILAAVAEAVGIGIPSDQIIALSLGTGTVLWPRKINHQ